MSYTVGTTHYNLPQTQGTDKRDWADTNQAFADLDAAVYEAATDSATAISTANSASSTAASAATDAASAVTTANVASATAQTASEAAALARTEAQTANTVAGQANTTAQAAQTTASNADTVALAAQAAVGDLTTLTTNVKTSAVAAINEIDANIKKHTMGTQHELTSQERNGYTAPSDGYIKAEVSSSNSESNYGTVSLDDVVVITIRTVGTQRQALFVKKGTVIKAGGEGTTLVDHYYFIPLA